jgi:hypothetical protein
VDRVLFDKTKLKVMRTIAKQNYPQHVNKPEQHQDFAP